MSKHTKGPWRTVRDNAANCGLFGECRIVWSDTHDGGTGQDVAYVTESDNDKGNANARLIAAAPRMYEELQDFINNYPNNRGSQRAKLLLHEIDAAEII